jgi:hypothetical protein
MGLNRVSNAKQLRRLSARVGQPVIRGYARYFANQNTVLAFTDTHTAWVVPKGDAPVERYTDENLELTIYPDGSGVLTRHPRISVAS